MTLAHLLREGHHLGDASFRAIKLLHTLKHLFDLDGTQFRLELRGLRWTLDPR